MILEHLDRPGIRSLSIFGLAKNVGKTTVLNAVTAEIREKGWTAGLVSIGVDGEERDVWTLHAKPPVRVPAGFLAATAASLLDEGGGDWEVVESTPYASPLGPVHIARARRDTRIKLAGITTLETVRAVERRFRKHGVRFTLVDGAYDRKAAASPSVTDAAVCVIGAGMARSLDAVVEQTESAFRVMTLPRAGDTLLRQAGEKAWSEGKLTAVRDGRVEVLPFSSLLAEKEVLEEVLGEGDWTALAIPGVLTDRLLDGLRGVARPSTLLLMDPTRCFVSLPELKRFYRSGGEIRYLHPIRLAAVAINPVSPEGYAFDPGEMKRRMEEVCRPIPVVDVMRDVSPPARKTE